MTKNLLVLFSLVLFVSCSSNQVISNDAREHMIESERITHLLHELDMEIYERSKSELDRDNSRRRYTLSLADTLTNLASKIEVSTPEALNKQDLILYKTYIKELYQKANAINIVAKKYEFEKLNDKLNSVQITCNNCHESFRNN